MVLTNAIEKSHAKNEENLSMKFRFMQTFLTYTHQNLWDAEIPARLKLLNNTRHDELEDEKNME